MYEKNDKFYFDDGAGAKLNLTSIPALMAVIGKLDEVTGIVRR